MPGVTGNRGLIYPTLADANDVPFYMQTLAEQLDVQLEEIAADPAGTMYFTEASGGGTIGAGWAPATNSAQLALPAGKYAVHMFLGYTLSPPANVRIEAHLFTSGGAAVGVAQQDVLSLTQSGATQTQTRDFTRYVELAVPTVLHVRRRTTTAGGVQTFGPEALTAVKGR